MQQREGLRDEYIMHTQIRKMSVETRNWLTLSKSRERGWIHYDSGDRPLHQVSEEWGFPPVRHLGCCSRDHNNTRVNSHNHTSMGMGRRAARERQTEMGSLCRCRGRFTIAAHLFEEEGELCGGFLPETIHLRTPQSVIPVCDTHNGEMAVTTGSQGQATPFPYICSSFHCRHCCAGSATSLTLSTDTGIGQKTTRTQYEEQEGDFFRNHAHIYTLQQFDTMHTRHRRCFRHTSTGTTQSAPKHTLHPWRWHICVCEESTRQGRGGGRGKGWHHATLGPCRCPLHTNTAVSRTPATPVPTERPHARSPTRTHIPSSAATPPAAANTDGTTTQYAAPCSPAPPFLFFSFQSGGFFLARN